jgi:cyclophilin family peptidyl-prolyl cis-trans isomerase
MRQSLRWILALMAIVTVLAAWAQSYSPRKGETVLRLDVEGRGVIYILLHTREAPKTTAHIIKLARGGFYDGQRFFRVVREPRPYLVALGDPDSRDPKKIDSPTIGQRGSGARIPYEETGFKNDTGAVGLSTLPRDRNSGDSQFYMLLSPSRFLDGNYTVFGKVVAGMDVLNRIEKGDLVVRASIVGG